jgi:hypothetical protein
MDGDGAVTYPEFVFAFFIFRLILVCNNILENLLSKDYIEKDTMQMEIEEL